MTDKKHLDPDMKVMGISGEIAVLRPEDKLIVRVPGITQNFANELDRHFRERLGEGRYVIMSTDVDVIAVPERATPVFRIPWITDEQDHRLRPMLANVFGEDGFILTGAAEVEL